MTADELEELIETIRKIHALPRWMVRLELELMALSALAASARLRAMGVKL